MHADTALASPPPAPFSPLRSALAVVAGIVVLSVTSLGLDAAAKPLMVSAFGLPDEAAIDRTLSTWMLTMAYTLPCVALGAYVTGWLGRTAPAKHAMAFAAVEIILMAMAWNAYPGLAPARNWILGMLLMPPVSWFGAWLYARRQTGA